MRKHYAVGALVVVLLIIAGVILYAQKSSPEHISASSSPDSITFSAVGDLGYSNETTTVLNGIGSSNSNFAIALGDLSYNEITPETSWCNYVKSKVGSSFPFELISGNHDEDNAQGHINNFAASNCLPNRISGLNGTYGKEYYFDYQGFARFIFVSPNLTFDGQAYDYTSGNAHYNWLATAIDGARSSNIPWVVVSMHKNCLTSGVKSCEIGTDLLNMLVDKKVDLVLQGHEHDYQRSKQLALSGSCASIAPNSYQSGCVVGDGAYGLYGKGSGAIFGIVGSGGRPLSDINTGDSEANYFAKTMGANQTPAKGFLKVNISQRKLQAEFVKTSGQNFVESFQIDNLPSHPDGTLIIEPVNHAVYLVQNGQRRYVTDPEVFHSYYENIITQSKSATAADMALPAGSNLNFRSGTLVKGSGPSLYVLSYSGSTLQKRYIPTPAIRDSLGYSNSSEWISISDSRLSAIANGAAITSGERHVDGSLVRQSGQNEVYIIENGQRRHLPAVEILQSVNKGKFSVRPANAADMALTQGSNYGFEEGSVVKDSGGLSIYVIDDNSGTPQKRHIASPQIHQYLEFTEAERVSASSSLLPSDNGLIIQ